MCVFACLCECLCLCLCQRLRPRLCVYAPAPALACWCGCLRGKCLYVYDILYLYYFVLCYRAVFVGLLCGVCLREVAPVCSIAPWISSAHPPLLHPRVVLMISIPILLPPLFPRQISPRYLYARHCQEIMFPTWLLLPPSRQISLRSLG